MQTKPKRKIFIVALLVVILGFITVFEIVSIQKLGAAESQPVPATTGNQFTIIQIPDSDEISRYCRATTVWDDMMDAIVASSSELNVKMVMSPGDVHGEVTGTTCSNDLDDGQFPYISAGYDILASNTVQYLISPANHDHDGDDCYPRDTTTWDATYPVSDFSSQEGFIANYNGKSHSMANFQSVDGYDFLFVTLEQLPENNVLTWLDNLIATSSPDYVVLGFQEVLEVDSTLAVDADISGDQNYSGQDGVNAIDEVIAELHTKYPDKFILTFGQSYLNSASAPTYEWGGKMSSTTPGGYINNYTAANFGVMTTCIEKTVLRYHVIDPDAGTIDVYTYNPVNGDEYTTDTSTEYYKFQMNFIPVKKDRRYAGTDDTFFSNIEMNL